MQFLVDPRLVRAFQVLFWLALVFACVMAFLPKPPHTPLDRFGDKIQHMIAFATLAGLATLAFGREARWRIIERLCSLGAVIEVVQSISWLNRTSDVRDWLADCIVVIIAVAVTAMFVPDRARPADEV